MNTSLGLDASLQIPQMDFDVGGYEQEEVTLNADFSKLLTENINLALDVAPRLKAGTVWVNCSNQFDAASGFGGYRESGFGREGGRQGLAAYCKRPGGWVQG